MGSLGISELLVILAIVLLVFGGKRLPEVGRGLGRAIRHFKDGVKGDDDPNDHGATRHGDNSGHRFN